MTIRQEVHAIIPAVTGYSVVTPVWTGDKIESLALDPIIAWAISYNGNVDPITVEGLQLTGAVLRLPDGTSTIPNVQGWDAGKDEQIIDFLMEARKK